MSWDLFLTRAINGMSGETSWIHWLFLTLCEPNTLWLPGIVFGTYWAVRMTREALIAAPMLTALIGLVDFFGTQLKHLLARPRPCFSLADLHQLQACGHNFSFPSNHAANTAAAASFLQVLYPRSGWVSWPIVVLVGLARVYVGAHYVSDVMGGWILGTACGICTAQLLLHWPRFRQRVMLPSHSSSTYSSTTTGHVGHLIATGRLAMTQLSQDILAYSRACERLLSTQNSLSDDERHLIEYYLQELSRRFVSPGPNSSKQAGQFNAR